jgi:hypothetical protein
MKPELRRGDWALMALRVAPLLSISFAWLRSDGRGTGSAIASLAAEREDIYHEFATSRLMFPYPIRGLLF